MAEATKEAPKAEVSKNCAGCNKPMKKIWRYYRNGKYYCNQKCFKNSRPKTSTSTEQKEQETT